MENTKENCLAANGIEEGSFEGISLTRECKICGNSFVPVRANQWYDRTKCRKAAERKRKREKDLLVEAEMKAAVQQDNIRRKASRVLYSPTMQELREVMHAAMLLKPEMPVIIVDKMPEGWEEDFEMQMNIMAKPGEMNVWVICS
jgi:hypothetical protein